MLNNMRKFSSYLICVFFTLFCSVAAAENLAYSDEWLKLLHYRKTSFSGYKGLAENPEFYVAAEKGRYNPELELKAEIKKFNEANNQDKCRFPARFNFLHTKELVTGNLDNCLEYQHFMGDIKPNGITLLFTNAYMNNPASLFGHTLIRIDTKRKGTQMLAHGSNFGANSGTEYGFMFAFKGLLGGYDGVYSIMPYWEIINTYNNIENRDIWEYKLNLSADEQQKFVDHLYEMRSAKIRYYFLRKNCSYMILELLEAVRPELEITDKYHAWVIPLDTLKTIRDIPDLIGEINYRPARLTKIKHSLNNMSSKQYGAFIKAVKNADFENSDLSETEYSEVLETAYQYFQYQYIDKNLELREYRQKSFGVLRRRSKLPKIEQNEDFAGENPYLSHDSMQISVAYGSYNKQTYEEFSVRPAYTALTDSSFGLVKGAQTEVFDSRWRYYNQKHRFVLQSFTPLKIKSLVPADRVFSPLSYSTDLSVKRELNPKNEKEGYVAHGSIGAGKTYNMFADFWIYGLAKIGGEYGGIIEKKYWLGVAPEIGIFKDFGDIRLHTFVSQTFADAKFGSRLQYHAEAAYGLSNNVSVKAAYFSSRNKGKNQEDFSLSLHYNF